MNQDSVLYSINFHLQWRTFDSRSSSSPAWPYHRSLLSPQWQRTRRIERRALHQYTHTHTLRLMTCCPCLNISVLCFKLTFFKKDLNWPEQIKEPGKLRQSMFCGQEGLCSSHSLISTTMTKTQISVSWNTFHIQQGQVGFQDYCSSFS